MRVAPIRHGYEHVLQTALMTLMTLTTRITLFTFITLTTLFTLMTLTALFTFMTRRTHSGEFRAMKSLLYS